MKATAIANSNIAFVKYWGKKDNHNIPMNPSISMTLDNSISTTTTVDFSHKYMDDIFVLNGENQYGIKLIRVSKFLDLVRKNQNLKAKVVSINTFPTAAGIASSASGFAALATASTSALNLELSMKQLSTLARQGSGSASRSIYGGFVEWKKEHAIQLRDEKHWPELRDVVVILSRSEKLISSRDAMKKTVKKSKLYKKRIRHIKSGLTEVRKAILKRNFSKLAQAIMQDSDNMHECIEEVGITYLIEESHQIKESIKSLNNSVIKGAYTFDAGPNAHIITLKKYLPEIANMLNGKDIVISKPGQGVFYSNNHLF